MDIDMAGEHWTKIYSAPDLYVEIGIDGQISTCCRAQDIALGYATSVEEFADVWFGKNYENIRYSLDRDAPGPLPLPNCEPCLKFFAPKEASTRAALKYDGTDHNHSDALDPNSIKMWHIDMIQKVNGYGHAFVFRLQPGINPGMYEFWGNQNKHGGLADSPLVEIGRDLKYG